MASMIVMMGTTTLIPVLKQPQAKAASLRQHSNLLNNCFRSNTCRDSNVGQGTLGNDNSVTGFGDLSNTINNTSTANSAAQGAQGAKGDPGAQGAQGLKGDPGPDKILSTRQVQGETIPVLPQGLGISTAECAGDEAVTGGGYAAPISTVSGGKFFVDVNRRFEAGGNGWLVEIFNNSSETLPLTAYAECAKLVPPP